MPLIQSNSDIAAHHNKNLIRPAPAEVGLYFLLSAILLLVLNSGNIIQKLSNDYIGSPEHLQTSFSTLSNSFSHTFTTALGGRLGQIILWSFIGALIYIGLWASKNVLNSFENDIIADHYLHPSNFSRAGYWGSSFSVKIFLLALSLILISYLYVVIAAVLPSLAALAGSAAYNFHGPSSVLYILLSLAGGAFVIYIGSILVRLVTRLWNLL